MLLDHNKFVVKSQSGTFTSKKSFEISDPDNGALLAQAKDITGFFPSLLGAVVIEVRDVSNNTPAFSVSRAGLLFKKDHVLDPQGQIVGRYKAKMFSLSGGFNVYDKDNKHIADIRGNMFKAEYKFVSPDGNTEMGKVSRSWGGLAKSMMSGNDTYGVEIGPAYASSAAAKMIMLGATIAVESIFKKSKEASSSGGGGGGGGGEE